VKEGGEEKGSARGSVHWGCHYATSLTLRLILNTDALAAASPTLLFRPTKMISTDCLCVFITPGPSINMCVWGGGGYWGTCATRDDEPRPVWTSLPITH
jgi:hypothetical protein